MDTATCFECSFSVLLPVIHQLKCHSFQGISQDLCLPGLVSSSVISSCFTLCFPLWNWLPCASVHIFDHLFNVSLLIRLSLCLSTTPPTSTWHTQKIPRCGGWMTALGSNLLTSDSPPGRRLSLTFAPHFCTLVPHTLNGWTTSCFTCLPVSTIHQHSGGSTENLLPGGVLRWQSNHYKANIHQRPVSHLSALWGGLSRWCLSYGF